VSVIRARLRSEPLVALRALATLPPAPLVLLALVVLVIRILALPRLVTLLVPLLVPLLVLRRRIHLPPQLRMMMTTAARVAARVVKKVRLWRPRVLTLARVG
jgi:hypothetical protein